LAQTEAQAMALAEREAAAMDRRRLRTEFAVSQMHVRAASLRLR